MADTSGESGEIMHGDWTARYLSKLVLQHLTFSDIVIVLSSWTVVTLAH